METLLLLAFSAVALAFVIPRRKLCTNPSNLPYPPGPRPYPLIGNLLDIPRKNEAQDYHKLALQYGRLVFLSALGRTVLVINDLQTAQALFEKRSASFSDRPFLTMMHELMGWGWGFAAMPYGEKWREHRKLFQRKFQSSVIDFYFPTQQRVAHRLLRRLLRAPQELREHLRDNAASSIVGVTYGLEIAEENDKFVRVAEIALDSVAKATAPGAFLVDLVPSLKYIPEWLLPGGGFHSKARRWREAAFEMRDMPFKLARQQYDQGMARPSFVSQALDELDSKTGDEGDLNLIRDTAGIAYAGGAESTTSTLASFFLVMILNPDVQGKAQVELDTVVGKARLPELKDREQLPYVGAIVKELLRWNPVGPLALPHAVSADVEYDGYFIPKGTIVLGNTRMILHDPIAYPEPEAFKPERWLGSLPTSSTLDPLSVAFGFGRRICPGRPLAEQHLWISIASILSVFDIGPGIDEEGNQLTPVPAFEPDGLICHPKPFSFSIVPRGAYASELIERTTDLS